MLPFGFFPLLMMVFAGGAGGDLLDYLPAEAYFKAQGIDYAAPALVEILEAPLPAQAAARPGDSARRQLALRSLADLNAKQALPTIDKLVNSADPLIADYARQARAKLGGAAYERPAVDAEDLQVDLTFLPSGIGALGQLRASGGKPVDVIAEMTKLAGGGGPAPEEMEAQIVGGLSQVIDKVGNFRFQALTFGLAAEIGPDQGSVVLVVRGLYNSEALTSLLGDRIGGVRRKIGGLTFHELESNTFYVAPVSDQLLVAIAGSDRDSLPMEEVARKVSAGGGDFAVGKNLAKLLGRVDREASLWAVAEITEAYSQAPWLEPFDTLSVTASSRDGGGSNLTVVAKGGDAAGAKAVVDEINNGLAEIKNHLTEGAEQEGAAASVPGRDQALELLKSIELTAEGGSAKLSARLKSAAQMASLPMLLLMPIRVEVEAIEGEIEELEEIEERVQQTELDEPPEEAPELPLPRAGAPKPIEESVLPRWNSPPDP